MPQAPLDLDGFRKTVEERYETLSDRLQRVARHLLDEPNDIAFEKLALIATRSEVQPSTIVRFAQAFGFEGASQMQRLVREGLLKNDRTLGYAERVRQFRHSVAKESGQPRDLLSEFVEGNSLALANLNHAVGRRELADALDLLEAANTVFVVGFRRSFPVASYLSYLLAQAHKRTVLVDGVAGLHLQQVGTLRKDDLVIAISFAPYSAETAAVIDRATAAGCPVVAISDSVLSPIARDARVVFQVRESEVRGFRSLSASMCLAQTLGIAVADRQTRTELERKE